MSEKLSLREAINEQAKQAELTRRAGIAAAAKPAPLADVITPADKKCPFCAETVKMEAIRCKHCQASLEGSETIPVAASTHSAGPGSMMAYDAAKKSVGVAYLLWLFFGVVGAHRFYAGKGSGQIMLGAGVIGLLLAAASQKAGGFILIAVAAWVIFDVFQIPGMVRDRNVELAKELGGVK